MVPSSSLEVSGQSPKRMTLGPNLASPDFCTVLADLAVAMDLARKSQSTKDRKSFACGGQICCLHAVVVLTLSWTGCPALKSLPGSMLENLSHGSASKNE